ncbi:MAG TPA: hypothetical protein DIU10_07185 [Sulfitobacter sp.]|nr:hypothetical protein [Sulfitobacter sp.]
MNAAGPRQKTLALLRSRRRIEQGRGCVRRPIVILFSDDSTLIFARRMREVLQAAELDCAVEMAWFTDESALSYRQITQLLPQGPDRVLDGKKLVSLMRDATVRAIFTSRIYRGMQQPLNSPAARWSGNRPCILSFLGGLDFFPAQGFARRGNCDGVYMFPRSAIDDYTQQVGQHTQGWQEIGFGHPSVMRPDGPPADLADRRDIYFFTQALSPSTLRGRLHMLRVMAAIAKANPERRVFIKLRHLPSENRQHLHLEKYDYPGLMAQLGPLPPNLLLTDITMEEALETAALGITCTSTAAMDLLRAGLPCMVYLDFVDAYRDPLVPPMRKMFQGSGVITSTEDLLNLKPGALNPQWLEDMFCPDDLGARVLETLDRFHARDFQIRRELPSP